MTAQVGTGFRGILRLSNKFWPRAAELTC